MEEPMVICQPQPFSQQPVVEEKKPETYFVPSSSPLKSTIEQVKQSFSSIQDIIRKPISPAP